MPTAAKTQVPLFLSLPKGRPTKWPLISLTATETRGAVDRSWVQLISENVHPVKVAVLEALHWIEEPLSASELEKIIGPEKYNLGVVSYHVSELDKRGVIQRVAERQVRGARECFYYFPAV